MEGSYALNKGRDGHETLRRTRSPGNTGICFNRPFVGVLASYLIAFSRFPMKNILIVGKICSTEDIRRKE